MKQIIFLIIVMSVFQSSAALKLSQYQAKPKLILLFVVDQFRADFYSRLHKEFLPAGTDQKPGGFRYLISKGAYYPTAEYKVMEAMTCPGHSIISTGAYPAETGIIANEWYDRASKRQIKCIDDDQYGASPLRLTTSTFGDELKIISPSSKVISVSLKDRAAIMLGGHSANAALWLGDKGWETSTYYAPQIPKWAATVNEKWLRHKYSKMDIKKLVGEPKSVEWEADLAIKAIESEKLGQRTVPDVLAISFSAYDIAGHRFGPLSKEVADDAVGIDRQISRILQVTRQKLGSLKDVVIVLTGDHGMPPSVIKSQDIRLKAGKIDSLDFYKRVNDRLNKKFGKSKKPWIKDGVYLNYYLDPDVLADEKVSLEDAADEVKKVALELPGVYHVFTASEFEKGLAYPPFLKAEISNQFRPGSSGDIVILPEPFFMGKDSNYVTHMTGFSYDRYVPLVIVGSSIKPGVYSNSAEVVDLAPTLSFILHQLPPAKASGRILNEIFKN